MHLSLHNRYKQVTINVSRYFSACVSGSCLWVMLCYPSPGHLLVRQTRSKMFLHKLWRIWIRTKNWKYFSYLEQMIFWISFIRTGAPIKVFPMLQEYKKSRCLGNIFLTNVCIVATYIWIYLNGDGLLKVFMISLDHDSLLWNCYWLNLVQFSPDN